MKAAQQKEPAVDYRKAFAEISEKNPVKFNGTLPPAFKYGDEPFSEFRKRFSVYALSAGWNGPKQMAAMLRCLPDGPTDIFMGWIDKGLLKDMDVTKMWDLMEARFSDPDKDRQKAKLELAQRSQLQGETVAAYEQVFTRLAERAELSEAEKVDRWKDSIDPVLSGIVHTVSSGRPSMTLEEAAIIARKAERPEMDIRSIKLAAKRTIDAIKGNMSEEADTKRKVDDLQARNGQQFQAGLAPRTPSTPRPEYLLQTDSTETGASSTPSSDLLWRAGLCYRCGEQEHRVADCRWKGTCNNCGREGHRENVCYKKRRRENPAGTQ